jgi:hypothetical protein
MAEITSASVSIDSIYEALRHEVYAALRVPHRDWKRSVLDLFLQNALLRVCRLAVDFDREAGQRGFASASRMTLPFFVEDTKVIQNVSIPEEGPLIIACNHPGSIDSLVISAQFRRPDIKLIARDMSFLRRLPGIHACMIYSTRDMVHRATVLRQALTHIEGGGALLLFASGRLDPDPFTMSGAIRAIDNWTHSASFFLKRVPHARIVYAFASGIIGSRWLAHPLARLRKTTWDQQFTAELLQTAAQALAPGKYRIKPKVSISKPFTFNELVIRHDCVDIHQAVTAEARWQMAIHMRS